MINILSASRRKPVIRIWIPYIYEIAEALESLEGLERDTPVINVSYKLYSAQQKIEALLNNSVYASSIRSCRIAGNSLVDALKAQTANQDLERNLTVFDIYQLDFARTQFKTAFLAEMGVWPAFFVSQKEFFDTLILLDVEFHSNLTQGFHRNLTHPVMRAV